MLSDSTYQIIHVSGILYLKGTFERKLRGGHANDSLEKYGIVILKLKILLSLPILSSVLVATPSEQTRTCFSVKN